MVAKTTEKRNGSKQKYCTLHEAASMLGINYQTVLRLARNGELKRFSYGKGMRPRLLRSSVCELMKKAEA